MKNILALILFFVTMNYANAQSGAELEAMVKGVLSSGGYSGLVYKRLSAAGESGAVALTKVINRKQLNANEIDSALTILTLSFASPPRAEIQSDRQPRTALFVLQYLELSTNDPKLLQRISTTRTALEKLAKEDSEKENTAAQPK